MTGPTNRGVAIAHVDADTENVVRRMCAAQGCTCGASLVVRVQVLSPEAAAAREAAGMPSGAKHSEVSIEHLPSCPLLARAQGRN